MPARLANQGYIALVKEATKGITPSVPGVFVPYYEDNMDTDQKLTEDMPIIGNKFTRFQVLPGIRTHNGSVKVVAEPNTAARWFDMLLNKVSTAGAGPYTHSFALNFTNPNSYTMDIARGQVVFRYRGVEASQIDSGYDGNKMTFNVNISALGLTGPQQIASVASLVLTLTTAYDPIPTAGYIVGDLVRLFLANGTTLDTTVTAVSNTTITVGSATGVATGDVIALRPQTPSLTLLTPFLWSTANYQFGVDAATALNAAQLRLEKGSEWTVIHKFENNDGAARSGALDPAELNRLTGDVKYTAKQKFDTPDAYNRYLQLTKRAVVARHYSVGSTYELRVTINNLRTKVLPMKYKSDEIIYQTEDFLPTYDTTDGQGFDVKIINNIATI